MLPAPALVRYVDTRVPAAARVGLALTASDAGYPFFGPALDRRLDLLGAGARDATAATWAFVSSSAASARAAGALRTLAPRWGGPVGMAGVPTQPRHLLTGGRGYEFQAGGGNRTLITSLEG